MSKKSNITITYLENLNKQIKSNNLTRQKKAFKTLKAINQSNLNVGLKMKISYYIGKVHYLNFRRDGNPATILKAMKCYHQVFKTVRTHPVKVNNPKYYFKYAETMHILSQHTECLFKQNELHNKAYQVALHSSKRFPTSTSLKWLVRHILSN